MDPLALSIGEAAKALGIGRTSVYVLIKQGRLQAVKLGRRSLILTCSIRALAAPAEDRKPSAGAV